MESFPADQSLLQGQFLQLPAVQTQWFMLKQAKHTQESTGNPHLQKSQEQAHLVSAAFAPNGFSQSTCSQNAIHGT